jgi:hypothetical protein
MAGLWMGTAVFSALKAKDFGGFVKSYLLYALLIIVVLMGAAWVLRKSGLLTEKFSVDEIQCQRGETPTANCYGEKGCTKPSGACYKLLNTATGPASA